jgi:hypothetical protein
MSARRDDLLLLAVLFGLAALFLGPWLYPPLSLFVAAASMAFLVALVSPDTITARNSLCMLYVP